mmetsp:Transcript_57858/g.135846  ORF Transcript_57858/g.135846 Transcript_57858/m.135846 type:complete len:203 (+) Transcript_57858:226-834(+)
MRIELGPKALDRAVDAVAHPLGEAGTQHEKDGDETEENPLLGLRDRDGRHEQRRQRQPRDAEERSAPDEVGFVAVERKDAQVLVQRPRHEQQQQHRARHVLDVPTEIQKHRDCHLAHHPQNFDPAGALGPSSAGKKVCLEVETADEDGEDYIDRSGKHCERGDEDVGEVPRAAESFLIVKVRRYRRFFRDQTVDWHEQPFEH